MNTRSATEFPDKLYSLEIRQYGSDGICISGTGNDFGNKEIGERLEVTLKAMDDCQLLLVARGEGGAAIGTLGSKSLDEIRKMSVSSSVITAIDPLTGDMNKMPYVLHLEHVKVAVVGGVPVIQSPAGSYDTRLLLKRLATRLTVNWEMADEITVQDYALKEVKLCQVPAKFSVIPTKEKTTEWGVTYPSSVVEFIDYYRLTDTELSNAKGTKTVWIPANVRGNSPKATSPYYRTKENAPTASSYVELAVDNSVKRERLHYRAYLGGEESTDFNLYENKNYNWTLKVSSVNYRDDGRIQLLDQTPVVSTNLVETANCFMMQPGTNICFNPYKHEATMDGYRKEIKGWNTYLTDGTTLADSKKITKVEVLWQVKDNATSGELVMGYAISKDNQSNLVRITDGDNLEKARIHVKVPITKGGNAVIAAYSGNVIVWSWHLWITGYVPQSITSSASYEQAQQLTQNGSVHQYAIASPFKSNGIYVNKVMMDRNLCAMGGGFPGVNASLLDFAKRIGYLYCWGRKDPFFGSIDGTANEVDVLYDGEGYAIKNPIPKVSYSSSLLTNGNSMQYTIEHPTTFIKGNYAWYNGSGSNNTLYLYDESKSLYDPCPAGWKVPYKDVYENSAWSVNNAYWFDADGTFKPVGSANARGGRLYNVSGNNGMPSEITIHNTAWFPITAYRDFNNGNLGYSSTAKCYQGTNVGGERLAYFQSMASANMNGLSNSYGAIAEPNPLRCVQK